MQEKANIEKIKDEESGFYSDDDIG